MENLENLNNFVENLKTKKTYGVSGNRNSNSVIEEYNSRASIDWLCSTYPELYEKVGNRAKRKGSDSGAGISLSENNRFISAHDNDVMVLKGYKSYTPFDLLVELDFNGSFKNAINSLKDPIKKREEEVIKINKEEIEKNDAIINYSDNITIYNGWLDISKELFNYMYSNCFIPKGYITLISASAGTGKSTFVASLIASYVKQEDFLEYKSNYENGYIAVILTEGSVTQYNYIFQKKNLTEEQRKKIVLIEWTGTEKQYLDYFLNDFEKNYGKLEGVVLDAYLGMRKNKSNNDVESANEGLELFTKYSKKYNCFSIIVAHSNKNQATKGLNPDNIIGTSYFVGIARQVAQLSRGRDKEHIYFQITKENTLFSFSFEEITAIKDKKSLLFGENFTYIIDKNTEKTAYEVLNEVFESLEEIEDYELLELVMNFLNQEKDKRKKTLLCFLIWYSREKQIDMLALYKQDSYKKILQKSFLEEKKRIYEMFAEIGDTSPNLFN